MESGFYGFETLELNTMTTEEKELWAKVINDARWYDGTPQMLQQLTEHFNKQGITVKNCSIPAVVGRSEQLVCGSCNRELDQMDKQVGLCYECGYELATEN